MVVLKAAKKKAFKAVALSVERLREVLAFRDNVKVSQPSKLVELMLSGLAFVNHFDNLAQRLGKRTNALNGLMPNLQDPRVGARTLMS